MFCLPVCLLSEAISVTWWSDQRRATSDWHHTRSSRQGDNSLWGISGQESGDNSGAVGERAALPHRPWASTAGTAKTQPPQHMASHPLN